MTCPLLLPAGEKVNPENHFFSTITRPTALSSHHTQYQLHLILDQNV
jgi:hypothetical protein